MLSHGDEVLMINKFMFVDRDIMMCLLTLSVVGVVTIIILSLIGLCTEKCAIPQSNDGTQPMINHENPSQFLSLT